MEKVLIGAGGFAREVKASLKNKNIKCFVDEEYYIPGNIENIFPLSEFNPEAQLALIVIGDPLERFKMAQKLPSNTKYFNHIHKSVIFLDDDIILGKGIIVSAGCILTTNIKIANHAQLNLKTTIGHDCQIDEYFTTAPGAKISGNCKIGKCVYVGTNASIREKITITDNVIIGLNGGVINNINESGVYAGTPSRKIKQV